MYKDTAAPKAASSGTQRKNLRATRYDLLSAVTDFAMRTASEFWSIMLDSGVWLVFGLVLAGVVHAMVPRSFMTKHLAGNGGSSIVPVLKASLLGIPMPLCSCSVIPVAASIRAAGATKGASAAFAISTPQTGEESVPLTWALFGPVYAISRPIVAVITAFVAGILIDRFVGNDPAADSPEPQTEPQAESPSESSCCGSSAPPVAKGCCCSKPEPAEPESEPGCCGASKPEQETSSIIGKIIEALRYGFGVMLPDLAPWLAAGLAASAVIAAAVPVGWIEANIGTGIWPMLLMLLVGLPLYVCATSTTPLAFTLVVAGLSPGAGLVLLLAGPATNAATMSWVIKDLGGRALVIYLVTIAAFSVLAGLLFDAALSGTIHLADRSSGHDHSAFSIVQTIGAISLCVLLVWALAVRLKARLKK